jgi:integrase
MRERAGLEMNPHLFRHAIAKIAVEADPGAYLAVSRVLGHSTLDTTMAHYLGTEGKAASRHLDRLLEGAKVAAVKGRNP